MALNCVGNGRILREGPFDDIWIQPAAGDAGGALGTALFIWHQLLDNRARSPKATPSAAPARPALRDGRSASSSTRGAVYRHFDDEDELCDHVAELMATRRSWAGCRGAWSSGRARSGSRSILGDARSEKMQSVMNLKIKFRESFRPLGERELEFEIERRGKRERYSQRFDGVLAELERRSEAADGDPLARFRSAQPCQACDGSRLAVLARSVRIGGLAIHEVARLSIVQAIQFVEGLDLTPTEQTIAERVSKEIRERLRFLDEVGLGYLTLDRASGTLSGGEAQRIRLATQVGASLMGVLYILDEPSIGLHPRDNRRLLASLAAAAGCGELGDRRRARRGDDPRRRPRDRHGSRCRHPRWPHRGRGHPEADRGECEASLTGAYLSGGAASRCPSRRRPRGRARHRHHRLSRAQPEGRDPGSRSGCSRW